MRRFPVFKRIYWVLSLMLYTSYVSSVYAQEIRKITLTGNNISIEDIFESIRQQTNLTVFYTNQLLNDKEKLNINFKGADLSNVLDYVLKGKGLRWSINDKFIVLKKNQNDTPVIPSQSSPATINIQGLVSDEKGNPLTNVTVRVKNTSAAIMTGVMGKYAISVPDEQAVLVFTHISYITEEKPVGKNLVVNLAMKPKDGKLDDVVVIGYGTARKRDVTAAMSSISKEALSQRTLFSLADAMKGKAAGVQITQNDGTPGSESTIRIRGASSVSAASTPLFVVDGVLQDDANNISPGDIESIEVLKDASGTAIYGSRGANGVIIITTKTGKSGKTQVEFYTNTGVQVPGHLYKLMNASEYMHAHYLASYVYSPASSANPNAPASVLSGYTYYRDTALGAATAGFWGVPTTSPYSTWKNNTSPDSTNTDWQKAMFQKSLVQEYRVSVLGGSKDTKFAFLGGYLDQGGLVVYSGYKRYNGRFNFQQNLSKGVTLSSNISTSRSGTNGFISSTSALNGGIASNSIIFNMLQQPPVNKLTYTDVEDNSDVNGYITSNPYSIAKYVTNTRDITEWIARLSLDWNINSNFMFRATGTYTNTNSNTDAYYPKSVSAGSKYNGRAVLSRGVTNRYLNENLLYYKGRIGEDHRINVMGGATFEQSKYSLITAENQNYAIETLGVFGLSNGTVPVIPTYTVTKWSMASFLSRAEYSFKNRYLATFTMRADGSSRFSPTNKWGYFPSAALAWRASEESFIQNITSISNLKFRASIGQSGNTAIPSYLTLSTIATYFSPMDGVTPNYGVVVDRPENLSLKWETTTQVNGGVDLGLFHDKINITADWYLKRTKDLLIQKVTPGYSGYRNTWTNLGSIQNSGLEISLSAPLVRKHGFNWNIDANIGFNRSRAIDIGDALSLAPDVVSGIGTSAIIRNGEPLGQWYGYQTNGIYQSPAEIKSSGLTAINGIAISAVRPGTRRFIDQNGDHVIDANDRIVLGQGQPVFTGGFSNSVSYKNFYLNIQIQYSYGNKLYNANRVSLESGRDLHNATAALANSWRPSLYDMTTGALVEAGNPNNQYRMAGSPEENLMLSDWIEDGSFIRLSDVTLSYQFDPKNLSRIGFHGLTLFASAKNLWIWTKYTGYDPEVNTRQGGFGDLMPSLDYASYPRSRVFSFGVKTQF